MKRTGSIMSKNFLRATIGATLLAAATLAGATTVSTTIDSVADAYGTDGSTFDSALTLSAGDFFTITASTGDHQWNNSFGDDGYWSGADGHSNQALTLGGLTAYAGTLVGEIGNGPLFVVGSNYTTGYTATGGELKLFYFDSDSYNNVGSVTATISAVPEPATFALMGLGLGLIGLSRRRKI